MANIFDYMKWRDISFKKVEFNEVDNLILARFSYFPFDGIVIEDEEITLKEAYERTKSLGTTGRVLQAEDIDLYPLLAKSIRFGNCKITNFENKVELEIEKKLGISGKQQIEEYGVEKFVRQCKESVFTYVHMWEEMTEKVGFWVDMYHIEEQMIQ